MGRNSSWVVPIKDTHPWTLKAGRPRMCWLESYPLFWMCQRQERLPVSSLLSVPDAATVSSWALPQSPLSLSILIIFIGMCQMQGISKISSEDCPVCLQMDKGISSAGSLWVLHELLSVKKLTWFLLNRNSGGRGKMTRQVKVLSTNLDNLSSIPGTPPPPPRNGSGYPCVSAEEIIQIHSKVEPMKESN